MKYHIDGVELTFDEALLNADSFEVASHPRSYVVRWNDDPNPCVAINQQLTRSPQAILLCDEHVFDLYGAGIVHDPAKIIKVPATETFKTWEGAAQVFDFLYQHHVTKSDRMVVMGGGIIQDVAAFVGSTYKRGLPWVYFPTTLLSMSDSCIGGKAGLNYKDAKNQIALFSTPQEVVINPNFLTTLAHRDQQSGLGEILKLCITGGKPLMDNYDRCVKDGKIIAMREVKSLIFGALGVKKAVIERDEFEANIRKALNYGHTIGHALESMSHYQIPHGIAVVLGLLLVNEISVQLGFLSAADHRTITHLCLNLLDENLISLIKILDIRDVIRYLKQDKKVTGTDITFVMLKSPGMLDFVRLKLDDALVEQITQAFNQLFVSTV